MSNTPRPSLHGPDLLLTPSETGLERLLAELCFRGQSVVLLTVGRLAAPRLAPGGDYDPDASVYMLGRLPPEERSPLSQLPDQAPFLPFGSPWPTVPETIRGGVTAYLRSVQERRTRGRGEGAVLASLGISLTFASPAEEAERWQEFRTVFDEVAPPIAEADRGLPENEDPGPLLAALLGPPTSMRMVGIEVDPNTSYTPWTAKLYEQEPVVGIGPTCFRVMPGTRETLFRHAGKRLAPVLRSLLADLATVLSEHDVMTVGAAQSEAAYRALAEGRPPSSTRGSDSN